MTSVHNPPQGTYLHLLQPTTKMTKGTQQKNIITEATEMKLTNVPFTLSS